MAQKITDSGFTNWTPDRLPDLTAKRYLITGANTGLGFEAAKFLAAKNADVIIASRNADKAKAAAAEVNRLGSGQVDTVVIDLASLEFVRNAAAEIAERFDGLDAIVNNAGVMQTPQRKSPDGYELQFATNHLGHFLLDGLLFDLVEKRGGRFVPVSSIAHKRGRLYLDDLMLTNNYAPTRAYCQSKLANMMYGFELDRRLQAAGKSSIAIVCHPGYATTNLQVVGPTGALKVLYRIIGPIIGQSVAAGAVPLALAAAGTEAKRGAYYGPVGMGDTRGRVSDSPVTKTALNTSNAARLWDESEKLTGFSWAGVLGGATADA